MSATRRVAVLGATGFVGSAVQRSLAELGCDVTPLAAPRLSTRVRDEAGLRDEVTRAAVTVEDLASLLGGFDVVVNAAGIAGATDRGGDSLYGANALLPGVLGAALASRREVGSATRLVHVSSAAVQGRRPTLTENLESAPFSPYSHSKALGEAMCGLAPNAIRFRPTSVHGPGRAVTSSLARLLSSPAACVAGSGEYPTPQVHVDNVGHAVAQVALSAETPPPVVLQPSEHFTAAELVRILGGREPRHVPPALARVVISAAFAGGRIVSPLRGVGRRLEILWRGQDQVPSWLESGEWKPVAGREEWRGLRCG